LDPTIVEHAALDRAAKGALLPADVDGGLADVLLADDNVGPLWPLVALVAVQRDGFLVDFDLAAVEADRDEGFDQGLAVLYAGGTFSVL
jgi:hypothetical protein